MSISVWPHPVKDYKVTDYIDQLQFCVHAFFTAERLIAYTVLNAGARNKEGYWYGILIKSIYLFSRELMKRKRKKKHLRKRALSL